ncbi:hypothetical protein GOP47_0009741 [Adiantum capillus-veneris]|uniref:Uncharacterized protein n=1 Tax=Adiantum capillus-veneris TaxID=13818 RepID=A0A9D4UXK4_ADICA|nr:hypothetical protein GOP47_0009741 [Adiantum capillus-veneris]
MKRRGVWPNMNDFSDERQGGDVIATARAPFEASRSFRDQRQIRWQCDCNSKGPFEASRLLPRLKLPLS